MKFILKSLLFVLLVFPATVSAELPKDVAVDFAVISGVVVMPINEEYIVDLDARDNLHIGDILTLVEPGKNIFHPQTGEVIGTVDEVLGYLQVTRVYSGYSYAKVLTEGLVPADGAPLKRFEQVPARLVVGAKGNADLAGQVKVELPQFAWKDASDTRALLTFTLNEKFLDVATQQGSSLHKYRIVEGNQLVNTAVTTSRPTVTSQGKKSEMPLQRLANDLVGIFEKTNEERFAEMDEAIIRQRQIERQGIWISENLEGHPVGLTVADLDGVEGLETVVAFEEKLLVSSIVEGKLAQVAEVALPEYLQVLTVDAMDLDADGRSELYLSALHDYKAYSFVVELRGDQYEIVIKNIPWLMRAVTLPGEPKPVLVGQRKVSDDQPFRGDVFRVQRKGDKLTKGTELELPDRLNVLNFGGFKDDQNRTFYAYLTQGDYLKIVSEQGDILWESASYFGGSEDCFMPREEYRDEMLPPICMPSKFIVMPGNELLVGRNDGQRMVQRYRKFKRSSLVALEWNGFAMNEIWRTANQPGYLGDFTVADADNDGQEELVMAVKFKHAGLTDKARSAVVIYELDE